MEQASKQTKQYERLREKGFSLVELLVVMTVVAVLAATLLSASGQSRVKRGRGQCLNNCKQLINGYRMYAQDNDDYALGAWPSPNGVPGWCNGSLISPPDAIDLRIITNSPTYPYVQSVDAFRCPDDESAFFSRGRFYPRNRSYSVNGFMGYPALFVSLNCPPYKPVIKLGEADVPGPSSIYVLIEEHANSLNDSHFLPFRNLMALSGQRWLDAPTGRHHNSAAIAFADGHVRMHKWKDSDLTPELPGPSVRYGVGHLGIPGPHDSEWFADHIAPFQ
jgi:prepilin-type N-terminal cleavage/methylation domain-containing protein/prepilin-type processing-associated H-X9-DG protein